MPFMFEFDIVGMCEGIFESGLEIDNEVGE
jgi:hypothetical protein